MARRAENGRGAWWAWILLVGGCAGSPASDDDLPGADDGGVGDTDDPDGSDTEDTDGADTDDSDVPVSEPTCTSGDSEVNPALGTVVCLPAGSFTMGCEAGRDDVAERCLGEETPTRTVRLTRSFWVMEAEVTQTRYVDVIDENPSFYKSCADCPVERVSWEQAVAFADAVSEAQGLTPCGDGDPYACDGWRLPTEAEWEYAARGGEDFAFAGSDDPAEVGWVNSNSGAVTHAGCGKPANGFGLCDMTGNVQEWTADGFVNTYSGAATTNPRGPAGASLRSSRGGYWGSGVQGARIAGRPGLGPQTQDSYLGFRLVRSRP